MWQLKRPYRKDSHFVVPRMGSSDVLRHGSQAALAEAAQNRSQKYCLDFSSTRASDFSGKKEGFGAQLLCPEARQEQRSPQSSQHFSFHLPPLLLPLSRVSAPSLPTFLSPNHRPFTEEIYRRKQKGAKNK